MKLEVTKSFTNDLKKRFKKNKEGMKAALDAAKKLAQVDPMESASTSWVVVLGTIITNKDVIKMQGMGKHECYRLKSSDHRYGNNDLRIFFLLEPERIILIGAMWRKEDYRKNIIDTLKARIAETRGSQ